MLILTIWVYGLDGVGELVDSDGILVIWIDVKEDREGVDIWTDGETCVKRVGVPILMLPELDNLSPGWEDAILGDEV